MVKFEVYLHGIRSIFVRAKARVIINLVLQALQKVLNSIASKFIMTLASPFPLISLDECWTIKGPYNEQIE